jgi:hypothetical protein
MAHTPYKSRTTDVSLPSRDDFQEPPTRGACVEIVKLGCLWWAGKRGEGSPRHLGFRDGDGCERGENSSCDEERG